MTITNLVSRGDVSLLYGAQPSILTVPLFGTLVQREAKRKTDICFSFFFLFLFGGGEIKFFEGKNRPHCILPWDQSM